MMGAIGVHAVARRLVLRRGKPFGAASFDEPTATSVDARLVAGAATFGVGWGVTGYCPGPALVALGTGSVPALVFVGGIVAGMEGSRFFRLRVSASVPNETAEGSPRARTHVSAMDG